MKGQLVNVFIGLVIAAVLFAGSVVTSDKLTDIRKEDARLSPKILHLPMAGFESVIADILWIRLIQFMGTCCGQDAVP